jgi:hypothetical protein
MKLSLFHKSQQHNSELYMGSTYMMGMTRKDKMREGFVARTFHIPIEIDDKLRMMAVKKPSLGVDTGIQRSYFVEGGPGVF